MSVPANGEELVEQFVIQLRKWLEEAQGSGKFTVEREIIPTPEGDVHVLTSRLEGVIAQGHLRVRGSNIVVPTAVPPPGIVKT